MTVLPAGAALLAMMLGAAPPLTAAAAPLTACRITDARLGEISGLTVVGDGYAVVNDGVDDAAGRRVFYLNRRCQVVRTVAYPSRPRDTEDLGQAADGTLWIADIGDNGGTRTTVALWRLAPGARKPTLSRLSYPDGAHDAEALLVAPDGTPVIVTKDPVTAGVYVPESTPRAGRTTPLRRGGSFAIPGTTTSNPFSFAGHVVITGGATSPDGRRAVLRTYADAFEFDVPDGDVLRAITEGTPRVIALPDEPQGESIAYRADGAALLTVSENPGGAGGVGLLSYPLPEAAASVTPSASPSPSRGTPGAPAPQTTKAAPDRVPAGALLAGAALAAAAATLVTVTIRRRRNR